MCEGFNPTFNHLLVFLWKIECGKASVVLLVLISLGLFEFILGGDFYSLGFFNESNYHYNNLSIAFFPLGVW